MSESQVTRDGLVGRVPGRQAPAGATTSGRKRRGEQPMVPDATFTSYYGKPVINAPIWKPPDIPGYLFLGGLAGASASLALAADLTARPVLSKVSKSAAGGAAMLSLVALVHDLGRPGRFLNMLRVFKVSSPMSVGSWLLAGFVPMSGVAAASALTGRWRPLGALATVGAGGLGPAVATYTAALICDTAVPAWHDGHREMPYLFAGSSAASAGGLGLLAVPASEAGLPRRLTMAGVATELAFTYRMERRLGMVAEPYSEGRSGYLMKAGKLGLLAGATAIGLGRRYPPLARVGGALALASSAVSRFGIFFAGLASADDPKYTVEPQRARLQAGDGSAPSPR